MGRTSNKRENCTSKYIGVCWNKKLKKWVSQITLDKKNKHLGYFVNELDARDAFRQAVEDNHLEHLYKNDVEEY